MRTLDPITGSYSPIGICFLLIRHVPRIIFIAKVSRPAVVKLVHHLRFIKRYWFCQIHAITKTTKHSAVARHIEQSLTKRNSPRIAFKTGFIPQHLCALVHPLGNLRILSAPKNGASAGVWIHQQYFFTGQREPSSLIKKLIYRQDVMCKLNPRNRPSQCKQAKRRIRMNRRKYAPCVIKPKKFA